MKTPWCFLVAAPLLLACERPWTLLETNLADPTWVAMHVSPQEVLLASSSGAFVRRPQGTRVFEGLRALDAQGQDVKDGRVHGTVEGPANDLYAWTDHVLLHRTTASFTAVDPPMDGAGQSLARAWAPLSVARLGGTMLVATLVGDGPGAVRTLLEGTRGGGWRRAAFEDDEVHQVTWVAVAPDGQAWAGDGRAGERTLYKRVNNQWLLQDKRVAPADVVQVVATADRLWMRNATGVRTVLTNTPDQMDDALTLPGFFTDLCRLADGRVVTTGPASLPWFSLWVLEDARWSNVNTGTRSDLHALACGWDNRIRAAGVNGVAVEEP